MLFFTIKGSPILSGVPRQLLRIMKLTTLLLIAVYLHVGAAGYGQKVTITGKDMPLQNVFKMIHRQSGYVFFYDYDIFQGAKKVTLNIINSDIHTVLVECLKDQNLGFNILNKTITIIRKKDAIKEQFLSSVIVDSVFELKGRIINKHYEPIQNANVIVKRTGKGTITSSNGDFILRNVMINDLITVSFIGYETMTFKASTRNNLTLTMELANNELDKVVVQGYGTTSQRLTTSNIGVVTAEEIEKQPVMNPIQALQGRVPGVVITQLNGYASAPFKIEIRGRNILNSNVAAEPLYVIDGVPLTVLDVGNNSSYGHSVGFDQTGIANGFGVGGQSPFFSINPQDIESVEILKDADATAIYGSRGANGVILISTKRGKAGKTKLDLNAYQGVEVVSRHWPMMNTHEYVEMRREALKNDGIVADENNAPDITVWDTTRYTDWAKYLYGNTAKVTDIQASLSGGDIRTTFRLGADYHHQTNILTVSGADQRGSLSFNVTHKGLDQRFSVSLTTSYSYAQSNMVNIAGNVTLPPNAPAVFDSRGMLNWEGWAPLQSIYPFGSLRQEYTGKTNFLNSNLTFGFQILKGLTLKASLGYNNTQSSQTSFTPVASLNPKTNPKGSSVFGNNNNHNWLIEPQLGYNGFIGKGKLDVLIGGSTQAATSDALTAVGTGYTNDALLRTISNALNRDARYNYGQYKYAALFGRINYNWENKYIVNISARRDGSSRFGPGKQFGNFASIGIAWIFTEEGFMKEKLPVLSFGKLRGSMGTTGSDDVGDYAYLTRWLTNGIAYDSILSLVPTQHANSQYQWQVNRKEEVALDLGFLKDRINIEVAFYRNHCNNQLIQFATPEFTGFTNVTANSVANVQNTGWEFLVNLKVIETRKVKWALNFNTGFNHNKLLGYPNLDQSPYKYTYIIGKPLNFIRLLHYTGVDPQTGLYTFADKNKDGAISTTPGPTDDRYIYEMNPKFNAGFNNVVSYKNLELTIFVYVQNELGNNALGTQPGGMNNESVLLLKRWQKPGDVSSVARYTTGTGNSNTTTDGYFHGASDGVFSNASFIRLQNLSLAYTLPERVTSRAGLQQFKIYLRGENLFMITKYKGLDPETQNFGGMPPNKVFTGGVLFNF